jgi:hypothetical protein
VGQPRQRQPPAGQRACQPAPPGAAGASIAVAAARSLTPSRLAPPQGRRPPTSYAKVDITEDFAVTMARMQAARAAIMQRQLDLLASRYEPT